MASEYSILTDSKRHRRWQRLTAPLPKLKLTQYSQTESTPQRKRAKMEPSRDLNVESALSRSHNSPRAEPLVRSALASAQE
jgi:hypothetical protein